jgi:hypothetical protein
MTVTVDRTVPGAPVVSGGPVDGKVNASTVVSYTVSGADADATTAESYEVSIDGGENWNAYVSEAAIPGITDATTEILFRIVDEAQNTTPDLDLVTKTVTVDKTAPGAPIVSGGPAGGKVNAASGPVSYTVDGAEAGDTYEVSVDGGENWDAYVSDAEIPGVTDATTEIRFRLVDGAGNPSDLADVVTETVTVDRTAPVVSIDAPVADSETTDTTPTLAGKAGRLAGDASTVAAVVVADADEVSKTEFDGVADVDSHGKWSIDSGELALGKYFAYVTQTDAAMNETTQRVRFRVVAPAAVETKKEEPKPAAPVVAAPVVAAPVVPVTPPVVTPAQARRQAVAKTTLQATTRLQEVGLTGLASAPSIAVPFAAPAPGVVKVQYLAVRTTATTAAKEKGKKAKAPRYFVVATGSRSVSRAGEVKVAVRLTKGGRKMVKAAKKLSLTVKTSFTAKGAKKAEDSTRKVTLKRKAAKAPRK